MLSYLLVLLLFLTEFTTWALPAQPAAVARDFSAGYSEPSASSILSNNIAKRVLNPDDQNISLWKFTTFNSGQIRNLRTENSDEARRELQQIRGALTQARVLAERALAVDANDPLWAFYFGNGPNQQATARRK